jgi:hypothetical protein
VAAFKLFDQFYGWCVVVLLAGLAPGFEPGLVPIKGIGATFNSAASNSAMAAIWWGKPCR